MSRAGLCASPARADRARPPPGRRSRQSEAGSGPLSWALAGPVGRAGGPEKSGPGPLTLVGWCARIARFGNSGVGGGAHGGRFHNCVAPVGARRHGLPQHHCNHPRLGLSRPRGAPVPEAATQSGAAGRGWDPRDGQLVERREAQGLNSVHLSSLSDSFTATRANRPVDEVRPRPGRWRSLTLFAAGGADAEGR